MRLDRHQKRCFPAEARVKLAHQNANASGHLLPSICVRPGLVRIYYKPGSYGT
jgi:hypothetical protein